MRALPWAPSWLDDIDDVAVAVGLPTAERRPEQSVPADPWFTDALGPAFTTYRSPGQRQAARALLTCPPGATVVSNLPTGSGKTEAILGPALQQAARHGGTSVVVVPTISLAIDMERRCRALVAVGRLPDRAVSYTSSTSSGDKARIHEGILDGTLPVLFASPEAVIGPLQDSLTAAAANGTLHYLAVDEAHLVREWGRDFREHFLLLSGLRDRLLDEALSHGRPPPRTVLASATLAVDDYCLLSQLFGAPGPFEVVAANALRPEPDYWSAHCDNEEERDRRLVEAVVHLPKPLLVYVSRITDARHFENALRAAGVHRVGVVTSNEPAQERADVVRGLRGDDMPTRFDIVVATTAFGLGVSYDAIRSVVHACLPESVDRFYQEVGRGGRDGNASVSLVLWTDGDERVQESLARSQLLKPATAKARWEPMWANRRRLGDESFAVDLDTNPLHVDRSVHDHPWNVQTLMLMQEAGFIGLLGTVTDGPLSDGRRFRREAKVQLAGAPQLESDAVWEQAWETVKGEVTRSDRYRLDVVRRLLRRDARVCELLAAAYDVSAWNSSGLGTATALPSLSCGACPSCRKTNPRSATRMPEPLPICRARTSGQEITLVLAGVAIDEETCDRFVDEALGRDAVTFLVDRAWPSLHTAHRRSRRGFLFVAPLDADPAYLPAVPTAAIVTRATPPLPTRWFVTDYLPSLHVLAPRDIPSPYDIHRSVRELPPEDATVLTLDDFTATSR